MPTGHKARALLLAAAVALTSPACAQEAGSGTAVDLGEAGYAGLVERVIEGHVRPAHEDFRSRAMRLAEDVAALCRVRSSEALARARTDLAATADGYFALLPLRFGPILQDDRLERLAFWPDPRGLGQRQVQALLAAGDAAAVSLDALKGKSVAVQGLTALDLLLSGTGSDALAAPVSDGDHRCRYAEAASANVAQIASELVAAWAPSGDGTRLFTGPGPDNPLFLTHREAAGEIVGAAASGLEIIASAMIEGVFGPDPATAKPKLAPFWRSGASLSAIASSLDATRTLIAVSGVDRQLAPTDAWLVGSIEFMLDRAAGTTRGIGKPIAEAVVDPASRAAIGYVSVTVKSLEGAIGRDLAAALGLAQGFNASDGD